MNLKKMEQDININNLLEVVKNNRYKCSICGESIFKGDRIFRIVNKGYQYSHTTNICKGCLIRIICNLNITTKEVAKYKKEYLASIISKK